MSLGHLLIFFQIKKIEKKKKIKEDKTYFILGVKL